MPGAKLTKHDSYVFELANRLRFSYESIHTNVKFNSEKRSLGEIDILAKRGDIVDIFEVKCSQRIVKARKQLSRLRRLVGLPGDSYFYCGANGMLTLLASNI